MSFYNDFMMRATIFGPGVNVDAAMAEGELVVPGKPVDGAHIAWSDGEQMTHRRLEAGVHIVTERSFDAAPNGRSQFLERSIVELKAIDRLTPEAISRLLAVHRVDDIDATCVLLPEFNYGTRSSTIIDMVQRRLRFCDGPPSEADYTDYSDLMCRLLDDRG